MPTFTDAGIRAAVTKAKRDGKARTLTDGAGRGTGRLVLMLRPMPERVLCEFYAQTWRDGRRQLRKLGAWPALSLAEARERFKLEAAPLIAERRPLSRAAGPRLGTVRELLAAYVSHLETGGRRSAYQNRRVLLDAEDAAAAFLGPDRLARDVTAEDCRGWLAQAAARAPSGRAEHRRQSLRAAFAHTLRAERSYTARAEGLLFDLRGNPVADIPAASGSRRAGERVLSLAELRELWTWAGQPPEHWRANKRYRLALRLLLLLGCRVEEALSLSASHIDTGRELLTWPTTKNGRPHRLPLLPLAAAELAAPALAPNPHGLLFPGEEHPSRPVSYVAFYKVARGSPVAGFSPRDLRRSWATWAADGAGLTWEQRERIQNHALPGVGEKHYAASAAHVELIRAGLAQWEGWLEREVIAKCART